MNVSPDKREKLVTKDQRRASSLKPAQLKAFAAQRASAVVEIDAYLDIGMPTVQHKQVTKTASPDKKNIFNNSQSLVTRFLANSQSPDRTSADFDSSGNKRH